MCANSSHCLNMTQFVSARAEDETVLTDMRRMPLPPTQRCEDNAVWCMGSRLMKYKCYKTLIRLHYILGYPIMRTSVSHPLVFHNQNNFIVKLRSRSQVRSRSGPDLDLDLG